MSEGQDDVVGEAEAIVGAAEIVVGAEVYCAGAVISSGLVHAAESLRNFAAVMNTLSDQLAPLVELCKAECRWEDEHVRLWDDEMPF